jgi:hypothetical protein
MLAEIKTRESGYGKTIILISIARFLNPNKVLYFLHRKKTECLKS